MEIFGKLRKALLCQVKNEFKYKTCKKYQMDNKKFSIYSEIDIAPQHESSRNNNIFFEISNTEKLKNTLIFNKRKSSLDYHYKFYIKRCNFTEKYILEDPIETIINMYF
jgi:hypothetical protein